MPLDSKKSSSSIRSLVYDNGDTQLHQIIKQNKKVEEIIKLISAIGTKNAAKMAKTYNNFGQLPIDLVDSRIMTQAEKAKLRFDVLAPLTFKRHHKPLSEPVSIKQTLQSYSRPQQPALTFILNAACTVANLTRLIINGSYTHLDFNNLSCSEQQRIVECHTLVRTKIEELRVNLFKSTNNNPSRSDFLAYYQQKALLAAQYRFGNCAEMTEIAFLLFLRLYPQLSVSMMTISHGNHRFLKIHLLERDGYTGKNIISNEVICDPWSGKVFPAKQELILSELRVYTAVLMRNGNTLNTLVKLNPTIHRLKTHFAIEYVHNQGIKSLDSISLPDQINVAKIIELITQVSPARIIQTITRSHSLGLLPSFFPKPPLKDASTEVADEKEKPKSSNLAVAATFSWLHFSSSITDKRSLKKQVSEMNHNKMRRLN